MTDLLPFIVVGVTAGSLYGLAGVGLTLTYRTTGVFNFAHGAVAAAAAYVFYTLHVSWNVPWSIALPVAVGAIGVVGGVLLERVARHLVALGPTVSVVATVGLMLAVQGLIQWRYGVLQRQFPQFLEGVALRISGVAVTAQQATAIAVAAIATVGLFVLLRTSRVGTEMRAVVDDPDLLDLTGANPDRVRTVAWVIGATFAALTGVLIAPFLGLDAVLLTLLVVQAFGAVAIGRFASLPLTYLGGIALGVGASLLTKWVANEPAIGGLPSSLPFLVLFVALIVLPPKAGAAPAVAWMPSSERRSVALSRPMKIGAAFVGVAAVLALPELVGAKLPTWTSAASFVIVFASLGLLVRTSGQVSLCHATFGAVGATSFAHLASSSGVGLPWFVALVLAGLAVVPIGALVAIPAIRLSGLHLALATFGFAVLMERVVYPSGAMFGTFGLRQAPRPSFAQGDTALFYVTVAIAASACGIVVAITRTRLGRLLRGLSESPMSLTTSGLDVNVTRVVVFAVSAFLAGVAGALLASAVGSVSGRSFGSFSSLLYLVILFVAGRALVPSAVIAAVALAVAPSYLPDGLLEHQALLFGVGTVAVIVMGSLRIRARSTRSGERIERSPVRARLSELAVRA